MQRLARTILCAWLGTCASGMDWARAPGAAIKAYNTALIRRPVSTNLACGAAVMSLGDASCQRFIEKKPLTKLDKQRFANAAIVGAAWSGFCSVQIYHFAERLIGAGTDFRSVGLKMLVTTAILSTAGNYINMGSRKMLGGGYRDPEAVFRDLNSRIAEVVWADWKVWPLYDVVCFKFVPQHVRGTTTIAANCLWGCYISFMANRPGSSSSSNAAAAGEGGEPVLAH